MLKLFKALLAFFKVDPLVEIHDRFAPQRGTNKASGVRATQRAALKARHKSKQRGRKC
jgi:hypothetical protein